MSLIGKMLVENGIVTETQLDEALRVQEKDKKRLGEILISLGYLKSKDLMWMLSEQADITFVDLKPEMLDSALISSFPEEFLITNDILPLYETDKKIYVVLGDPTRKDVMQNLLRYTTKEIVVSAAEPEMIHTLLQQFFLEQSLEETIKEARGKDTELRFSNQPTMIEFIDKEGNRTEKKAKVDIYIRIEGWQGGIDE
jgi:type IV pilus assembly protein PilB